MQPRTVLKNHIIIQGFSRETPVNLLIDSGASISLVNTRLLDSLNVMDEVKPTSTLIAGLGKKVIPIRGEIKLPIHFGNMQLYHTFIICDNLDNEFIIGVDVLRKYGMKIDFSTTLKDKKIRTLRVVGHLVGFFSLPRRVID